MVVKLDVVHREDRLCCWILVFSSLSRKFHSVRLNSTGSEDLNASHRFGETNMENE